VHHFPPRLTLSLQLSSAMASLLLASPPPLSTQLHTSTSHLSFSHSQTLFSPLSTPFPSLSASATSTLSPTPSGTFCNTKSVFSTTFHYYWRILTPHFLIYVFCYLPVYCGRGDRKTAKGKRFAHSFGNVIFCSLFLFSSISLLVLMLSFWRF